MLNYSFKGLKSGVAVSYPLCFPFLCGQQFLTLSLCFIVFSHTGYISWLQYGHPAAIPTLKSGSKTQRKRAQDKDTCDRRVNKDEGGVGKALQSETGDRFDLKSSDFQQQNLSNNLQDKISRSENDTVTPAGTSFDLFV